jgi:hypothetical protein
MRHRLKVSCLEPPEQRMGEAPARRSYAIGQGLPKSAQQPRQSPFIVRFILASHALSRASLACWFFFIAASRFSVLIFS